VIHALADPGFDLRGGVGVDFMNGGGEVQKVIDSVIG